MSYILTSDGGIKELGEALLKAKASFGPLLKSKANEFFKSKYADLNALLDVVEDPLLAQGVLIVQGVGGSVGVVFITTRLWHVPTGQWMESTLPLTPKGASPQDAGSAITYARRYGLQAILCLSAEDDDGNKASGREKQPQQQKPRNAGLTPAQSRSLAQRNPGPQAEMTTGKVDPMPPPVTPTPADEKIAAKQEEIRLLMRQIYGEGRGEEKLTIVKKFWKVNTWTDYKRLSLPVLTRGLSDWKSDLVARKLLPESEGDDLPSDFGGGGA